MGNFCCFISKKVENRRDKDIFQEEIKCQNIIEEKQIEFELEKEIEHEIFKEVNLKDNIEVKIAFKANHGTKCLLLDNINYKLEIQEDINDWIKNIFLYSEWTNWIVFNNQQEKDHSSKGHSKGFILWNDKEIGILNHSIPNFPSFFDGKNISDVDKSELVYAQHLCFINKIPILQLKDILNILMNKDPHIIYEKHLLKLKTLKNPKVLEHPINSQLTYISKNEHLHNCIYLDHIVEKYECELTVQSWIRQKNTVDNKNVIKAKNIKWPIEDIKYKSTQDHSKYFISNNGFVGFSDLNLMESQKKRGGGCLIIKDEKIYNLLKDMIE